jgi:hypothetical protein
VHVHVIRVRSVGDVERFVNRQKRGSRGRDVRQLHRSAQQTAAVRVLWAVSRRRRVGQICCHENKVLVRRDQVREREGEEEKRRGVAVDFVKM